MTVAERGKVYLVGAGPGDPELLTIRGSALLQTGDVIFHDDLVPEAILALAQPAATVISVGKRRGAERVTQNEINQQLIVSATEGLSVIRLKSGDPMIFGRAREEMEALTAAGVPYEVVPGVTVALAAAAVLSCSLTERNTASSVLFLTGHHAEELNPALPPTRVVYMPGPDLSALARDWLQRGEPSDMPCALLGQVAQADQSILRTTLGELVEVHSPDSPSILQVGWALSVTESS